MGKGSYGDRVSSAGFNTEKFSFFVTKSYGIKTQDQDFIFYESDPANPKSPNLPKFSAKPITKYEGGDLKVPFEWREVKGEFEIAGKKRFDEEANEDKRGLAFALNATSPKFIVSLRNIGKGYESNTRTTDITLKAALYKAENFSVNTGYRIMDFSGGIDTRHALTGGIQKKIENINIGLDTELYKQG